jgi:hypothetical protein
MTRKQLISAILALIVCFVMISGCHTVSSPAEVTPSPIDGSALEKTDLTLSIPALEGTADLILEKSNPDGTRQQILLYDAVVGITISRLDSVGYSEDAVSAQITDTGNTAINNLAIVPDDTVSAQLTYPAWRISYTTGENEDTCQNTDIYIQTDAWDFYFHTSVPVDYAEDYSAIIESWIASFNLIESE